MEVRSLSTAGKMEVNTYEVVRLEQCLFSLIDSGDIARYLYVSVSFLAFIIPQKGERSNIINLIHQTGFGSLSIYLITLSTLRHGHYHHQFHTILQPPIYQPRAQSVLERRYQSDRGYSSWHRYVFCKRNINCRKGLL